MAAAVRLDGERLKAFIVPKSGVSEDSDNLEAAIRGALLRLPAVARPERLVFGTDLPITDTGKAADW